MFETKPKTLYIDTEFLREKTYFSKLCLIQVNTDGGEPFYLDPLDEGEDIQPFYDLLMDKDVVKVMHAGRQDLEIFYHMLGDVPPNLFDTQIAAALLGYGDQVAYAALVNRICKVELDKGHQFTDWSRRPLSDSQIKYALNDVEYLPELYKKLRTDLEAKGRMTWLEESQQTLSDASTYSIDPETIWQRIKMRSDKPKHLVVLQALAQWREERAVNKDMPRNFILKDDTLCEIAMTQPKDQKALGRVRGLSESQAQGWMGKELMKVMCSALERPQDSWPTRKKAKPFDTALNPVLDMVRLLLKAKAVEAGLSPTLIATTDDLKGYVLNSDDPEHPLNNGWRYKIFGHAVQDLIAGKLVCKLEKKKILFLEG